MITATRRRTAQRSADADPQARLHNETMAQWRMRIAIDRQMARAPGEPLIPAEAEANGAYDDGFVVHVETNTKAWTKRNRTSSAITVMHQRGQLTPEQFSAAQEIAFVAEAIARNVGVTCASMEARVDHAGSGRDALVERLSAVRREQTYNRWRQTLPMPRRLVLDMLLSPRAMVASARIHNVPWRKARACMIDALDRWNAIGELVRREIGERDVDAAHARIAGYLTLQR